MLQAAAVHGVSTGHWVGVPLALAAAVLLSLGTWFQSRGVVAAVAGSGPWAGLHLAVLVRRPAWTTGAGMLGAAVVLQLSALRFSPLTVVQPIGAVALVVTELTHLVVSGRRPAPRRILAVLLCVGGIAGFVVVAGLSVIDVPMSDGKLRILLVLLSMVVAVVFGLARRSLNALVCTIGAGVLYGFVATLAKTVLGRIVQRHFQWLSVMALTAVVIAAGVGAWLVQHAHTGGRPELIVAGLTVVDPMVAVALALTVLGEADTAPPVAFLAFALTGALAVTGVVVLTTAAAAPASGQP